MKQLFYIFIIGLLSCNVRTENNDADKQDTSAVNQIITASAPDNAEIEMIPVFSLSKINRDFPFDNWLCKLTNADSIARIQSKVDSLKNGMFTNQTSLDTFRLELQWTLEYYECFGWEDHFAGRGTIDSTNQKYVGKYKTAILTSQEIFDAFRIGKNSKFPLNKIPEVYERDARYNGEWTPIYSSNDNLIIRWVGSYPNGNQTSWYNEKIYYFKRHE